MNYKKVQSENGDYRIAAFTNNQWQLVNTELDFFDFILEEKTLNDIQFMNFDADTYRDVIPFRPSAYRDFMLFEKHYIDASRGFVKKYMPRALPIIKTYESLFKKPFPKLKPNKRYYEQPIYYMGNHLNFLTHGDPIKIPTYTKELDYELEIAAVISKPLKNASLEEVEDAIAGFVILNDFSARDVQMSEMESGFGPMKSKNFGNAISSTLAPKHLLINKLDCLSTKVIINDEIVATGSTDNMYYSMQQAIAYASWEEQLHPYELFGSGTIPGCTGIENGVMLNVGDKITLEVEGIGQLTNKVVA